jgi:TPR repeat protein/serine/threonine protein kinase
VELLATSELPVEKDLFHTVNGTMDSQPKPLEAAPSQELPPGTQLEEFVVERVLGSGGFGITYLAKDSRLGRQVVIKENLPAQFCWRDPSSLTVRARQSHGEGNEDFRYSLDSFEREASTLASLDHPGIVRVLRSFEAFGTAYFVMPFVEGTALDEVIRQRHDEGAEFSEQEVIQLLRQMLPALANLHERGIYHRDIKPGNLLITQSGAPVLIDFGAARQRLSERSLTVIESAGYTPFEQMQSRGKVGPWSDLYALGASLYKVITGETPHKSADRIIEDSMEPLAERPRLLSQYSKRLLASIDRAMKPNLSERFQDALQWESALNSNGEGSKAPAAGETSSVTKPPKTANKPNSPVSTKQPNPAPPFKVSPKLVILGGVAALSVATVFIVQALRPEPPPKEWDSAKAPREEVDRYAKQGYPEAMIEQAKRVLHRFAVGGDEKPSEEAAATVVDNLRKLADEGNPSAMATLGICYARGLGVMKAEREALHWFTLAADNGSPKGFRWLGWCHEYGEGVSKNVETARKWYRSAAEAGDVEAMLVMANFDIEGIAGPIDKARGFDWSQRAAEMGYPEAMRHLGLCYEQGIGVTSQPNEAVRWYRRAMEAGHREGTTALANCYSQGSGVEQNQAEAFRLFKIAALDGDPKAMASLTFCLESGTGTEVDNEEAAKWLRKAAELGNPVAQMSLGLAFLNGRSGLAKDQAEGLKWLQSAADLGEVSSMRLLADKYHFGMDLKKSASDAIHWYRKAAELDPVDINLKLRQIVFPEVAFTGGSLDDFIHDITIASRDLDTSESLPVRKGIPVILDVTDHSITSGIDVDYQNVPAGALIEYVAGLVGLKHRIESFGVVLYRP